MLRLQVSSYASAAQVLDLDLMAVSITDGQDVERGWSVMGQVQYLLVSEGARLERARSIRVLGQLRR